MRSVFGTAVALSAVAASSAEQIVLTVSGTTTTNASTVSQLAEVTANIGGIVFSNFQDLSHDRATVLHQGWDVDNRSAIQSEVASPRIPAHDTNITVNGFNLGSRDGGNGAAITSLPVTMTDNNTIMFCDANTCAEGGVGGITVDESSTETLDGLRMVFADCITRGSQRNAMRLNGTSTSLSSLSATRTEANGGSSSTSTSSAINKSSGAERAVALGLAAVVPMIAAAFLL
ncbi:hypothetical protein BD311DRAFT_865856 [Dichomitus squalens]|uniref:Uncharacterized protein n=1 Tax=Dichomitus squalens TaxID=114155 RepID=A0A4Q9MK41_9APHY|nr:hypothetical protein BD311DRAFT_865856 [Dichomitus squalens]